MLVSRLGPDDIQKPDLPAALPQLWVVGAKGPTASHPGILIATRLAESRDHNRLSGIAALGSVGARRNSAPLLIPPAVNRRSNTLIRLGPSSEAMRIAESRAVHRAADTIRPRIVGPHRNALREPAGPYDRALPVCMVASPSVTSMAGRPFRPRAILS